MFSFIICRVSLAFCTFSNLENISVGVLAAGENSRALEASVGGSLDFRCDRDLVAEFFSEDLGVGSLGSARF